MRYQYLALAIVLTASSAGVFAQQQQSGRESVYAAAGISVTSDSTRVYVAPFGRDTVYASQLPYQPAALASNAPQIARFGRDSVYMSQSSSYPVAVHTSALGLQQ